jgi:hypothetical protein
MEAVCFQMPTNTRLEDKRQRSFPSQSYFLAHTCVTSRKASNQCGHKMTSPVEMPGPGLVRSSYLFNAGAFV